MCVCLFILFAFVLFDHDTSTTTNVYIYICDYVCFCLLSSHTCSISFLLLIQVFDEYTPQLEVYKETMSTLPRLLLNGVSCAVMAYGQTGSGKVSLYSFF